MFKNKLARILWFILIVMFFLSLPFVYFSYQIIIPPAGMKERIFEIKEGESLSQVVYDLKKEGLIRSSFCFKLLAHFSNNTDKIKFGEYSLNSNMSTVEILRKFIEGEVIAHPVTIPEGFTARKIADLLEESHILNKCDFMNLVAGNGLEIYEGFTPKNLEGYLFPDSYFFAKNTPPVLVIKKMVFEFKKRVLPLFEGKKNYSVNGLSFEELITLASIIEAEAKLNKERPLIASVYYNRLKEKMPLECDATIQYVLEERKANLKYSDLNIKSPYNTYINKGLPPTPICNPGIESIRAALYPARTGYLFYVRNDKKGDGSHIFSGSYNQHLEAIRKYQKY